MSLRWKRQWLPLQAETRTCGRMQVRILRSSEYRARGGGCYTKVSYQLYLDGQFVGVADTLAKAKQQLVWKLERVESTS